MNFTDHLNAEQEPDLEAGLPPYSRDAPIDPVAVHHHGEACADALETQPTAGSLLAKLRLLGLNVELFVEDVPDLNRDQDQDLLHPELAIQPDATSGEDQENVTTAYLRKRALVMERLGLDMILMKHIAHVSSILERRKDMIDEELTSSKPEKVENHRTFLPDVSLSIHIPTPAPTLTQISSLSNMARTRRSLLLVISALLLMAYVLSPLLSVLSLLIE